jgi:phosphoglycerate kinase
MAISWIDDPQCDLTGKRVFCRVDFNVPMTEEGVIIDDTRIVAALPTIECLIQKGARVILASHLGRPKGKVRKSLSLESVAVRLQSLLSKEIILVEDCVGDGVRRLINELPPGEILMLENLRFHSGEEKNDESFAKMLAQNLDVYVNDAFGAVHNAHASIEGMVPFVPQKLGGLLMRREVEALQALCRSPAKPYVAVLGGAKVSDKLGALNQLLPKINRLVIGGAMAYTFLKAQGHNIGASRYEEERLGVAQNILTKAAQLGVEVVLPKDHVVMKTFSQDSATHVVGADFAEDDMGVDIGPLSQKIFAGAIPHTGTVFWNGPMGVFEWDSCFAGTKAIADAMAASKAFTVAGGGDSIAALKKAGQLAHIKHVSTGGGASLKFIEGVKLPGLVALGHEF